ncbi:MAG TPA: 23S rRNA (uracil(1939)-C(5))-methyltransferase RlmD [Balneolales bacterium]|nr:23S rRNA (uracil(1939)-C(5))-methyltransferase RlmD [Balneolales bacterium]
MSVKKGDIITVEIESAAFEGKGVGHLDAQAVFVRNTAPGDIVKARVIKKKKNYLEAKLLEVEKAGPVRIEPRCQHAYICGGCTWQHIPYHEQLVIKRQHVEDHLHRIGGLTGLIPPDCLPSERAFYYRNKMEYSFGNRRWLTEEEILKKDEIRDKDTAVGLHVPGRYDRILNLHECHLQDPVSFKIMDAIRTYSLEHDIPPFDVHQHTGYFRNVVIRTSDHYDDLMVNVVTYTDDDEIMQDVTDMLLDKFPLITTVINNINDTRSPTAVGRYEKIYHGPGYIRDKIGPFSFNIHANAFFQTNTRQAERLYDTAVRFADIQPEDHVYDLYCGVGTLTLYASQFATSVVGIEINEVAIENARKNAAENGIANCKFLTGDMKDLFTAGTIEKYGKPDLIITDPPRSGMHPDVVRQLLDLKAGKIVYVSCNSSTLARDLKELNELYEITDVQPVDMFPQTYHIETVANLQLRH